MLKFEYIALVSEQSFSFPVFFLYSCLFSQVTLILQYRRILSIYNKRV